VKTFENQDRYGENLLTFTLHQDETTPHFQALIVPITTTPKTVTLKNGEEHIRTGHRLTAAEMFSKETLRQLQSDYADAMAPFGLVRGVEKSPARHEDIKRTYGLNRKVQELDTIVRSGSEIVGNVNAQISDLTEKKDALSEENQRLTQQLALQQQQIRQLQRTNDDLRKAGQIIEEEIKTLRNQKTGLKTEVQSIQSDVKTLSDDNARLVKENGMQRENLKYLQKQANESRKEQGKAIKEVVVPPKPDLKSNRNKL
jgi:septal ring factor EnvC (AmiA/AmiB activator)